MAPSITDWMMVGFTVVYVFATILICYFNGKSVKAVKAQTEEMQMQFALINRPIIAVELVYLKKAFWAIRLTNQGALTAFNTKIELDTAFIESIPEQDFKDVVINDIGKVRAIGVQQHYDLFFGTSTFWDAENKSPIKGHVVYFGRNGVMYTEDFEIDVENYADFYSVDTDLDDLKKLIKEQNMELALICKSLKRQ